MDRQIIIKGDFTVEGLTGSSRFTQNLKYLKIRIGYPEPMLVVLELKSKEGELNKIPTG